MKCDSCDKNEATIHLTQPEPKGNEVWKAHLCETCAQMLGVFDTIEDVMRDLGLKPGEWDPKNASSYPKVIIERDKEY